MQVKFNRKVLALSIASTLGGFVAVDAQAVVTLGSPTSGITYAKEMVVDDATAKPVGGFINGGRSATDPTLYPGTLDIKANLGFGVGTGAPSYLRIDLSNTKFVNGATFSASVGGDILSSTNISAGGSDAAYVVYAYTPQAQPGPNATVVVSATAFRATNKNDATATYRLYASATDAASGTSNYLAISTGRLWTFGDSYAFTSKAAGDATPKIEVAGGSKYFVGTTGTPVGTYAAQIGLINLAENALVYLADGVTQVNADPLVMNVVTAGTKVKIEGEMSFAPFLGSVNKIFAVAAGDCATGAPIYVSTTAPTDTVAYLDVGTATFTDLKICVQTAGTLAMDGGLFKATYMPTVDAAAYVATAHDTLPMQKLVKNGKTFKVLNLPGSAAAADQFFIRIYNTGSSPANVLATVYNQDGTLVGTAAKTVVTGLAANTVYIVDLAKLETAVAGTIGTGRAWARLEAESTNIAVALMLRNVASGVLVNGSASVVQDQ